ncbi:MAG: hypothetical protein IKZ88_00995 [Neisseriaceae bacterium]|nr:hypothetical protein [Neisseriaceae bacterium]
MSVATLQHKVSLLPPVFVQNAESYIDFLLMQSQNSNPKNNNQIIDFSKYKTNTKLWSMDAQTFVRKLRNEERF